MKISLICGSGWAGGRGGGWRAVCLSLIHQSEIWSKPHSGSRFGFLVWAAGAFVLLCACTAAGEGNYLTHGRPSVSHSLKDVSSFARHCRWETEAKRGKEKDTDTRWTAFEWLHGSHFIVFCLAHSSAFFFVFFLPELLLTVSHPPHPSSPFHFLSFELISHPPFWWRSVIS